MDRRDGPEWLAGPPVPPGLLEVLGESQGRGLIGAGPLEAHVRHAMGFAAALEPGWDVVDLGSGGGVPGLALAVGRPDLRVLLVDSARRRVKVLEAAVDHLGLVDRVAVAWGRAEDLGRDSAHRECHDAVVARLFGPPAVTAECARPFVRPGGRIVVSEPPDDGERTGNGARRRERWPREGLQAAGLELGERYELGGGAFQVLVVTGPCPERLPRRAGVPARRPLF